MLALFTDLDRQLFIWINSLPHSMIADAIFGGLWGFGAAGLWWFPVILQQIYMSTKRLVLFFLTVTAFSSAYTISELFMKEIFQRSRPGDVLPGAVVRLFGSPSTFSFPSSHAAVSFAMAFVLSKYFPVLAPLNFGFAIIISLSRVYIGLHFPSDIMYGALIGTIIGWLVVQFGRYAQRFSKD